MKKPIPDFTYLSDVYCSVCKKFVFAIYLICHKKYVCEQCGEDLDDEDIQEAKEYDKARVEKI